MDLAPPTFQGSFPEGPGPDYECERLKGVPTAEEFLTKYVAGSRPVILEDVAALWPAIAEARWNMSYLVEKAGATVVKVGREGSARTQPVAPLKQLNSTDMIGMLAVWRSQTSQRAARR